MTLAGLSWRLISRLRNWLCPVPGGAVKQTPPVSFPMLIYSHRGGPLSSATVENTLPAFQASQVLGVHVLELDVQLTRDNVVVVFHDTDLGRMAGPAYKGKKIADLTLAELPPVYTHTSPAAPDSTRSPVQPVASHPVASPDTTHSAPAHAYNGQLSDLAQIASSYSWLKAQPRGSPGASPSGAHSPSDSVCDAVGTGASRSESPTTAFTGMAAPPVMPHPAGPARIPTLESIFRQFPDTPIQLDVKVDTPGLVQAVYALVTAHPGRRERLLWGSFNHKVQCQLYDTDPGIPLFGSAWRTLLLRAAFALGCLHQVPVYESVIIVPWRMRAPWRRTPTFVYPFLDRSWITALAARGVSVVVFGRDLISDPAFQRGLDAGAAALCTDDPARLCDFLRCDPCAAPAVRQLAAGLPAHVAAQLLACVEGRGERREGGAAANGH